MNLIKPQSLNKGDTVEIIAPSGAVDKDLISRSKVFFEKLGYKVKYGKHIFENYRYMSANDEARLEDLHNAFLSDETKAIVCARGGYGAIRLADKLDYKIFRNNPKIFCGYSDITALSLMMLKKSDLMTFSGPMAQSDFADDNPNEYTARSFFEVISEKYSLYNSKNIIKDGSASGIVWGGNLSTIASLCGTDFIPDEKFIFFLEDVNEPVYKLDKMLNQLINIPDFRKNIAAAAFGEFLNVDNEQWLFDLVKEFASTLNIPAASGFKFSHGEEKQTIPVGIKAEFNGTLKIV